LLPLPQVRCPKTGYLRTLPFEGQCPLPEAFQADSRWLDGLLAPVIKPKGAVAAGAPPANGKAPEAVGARAAAAKASKAAAKADKAAAPAAPAATPAAPAAMPAVPAMTPAAPAAAPTAAEAAEAFGKARLAVGRVLSAAFVEGSDKLYLCQVEVGEPAPRQVITGLRKFVAQEALQGAQVVVILNLKPAKLAGHASQAMILAAEVLAPDTPEGRRVLLLRAPSGAAPGDAVLTPSGPAATPPPKECKSAPWALVKSLLSVQGGKACFAGAPLSAAAGEVLADAPDGSHIG
jgi:aminoacyl tRNA synthase complex-interacting multifunctional protein 1